MNLIERIKSYQERYELASTKAEKDAILQSYTADRKLIGGTYLELLTMPPFREVKFRLGVADENIVHYISYLDDSRAFKITDEQMLKQGIVALVNLRFTTVNRDGIRCQTTGCPVYIK